MVLYNDMDKVKFMLDVPMVLVAKYGHNDIVEYLLRLKRCNEYSNVLKDKRIILEAAIGGLFKFLYLFDKDI